MPQKGRPFRVGRVRGYLRGRVWYLCYWENGKRRRPRVGADRGAAKRLAAEVNSQLEAGAPSVLSFEKVSIPELRRRWLDHHENVRRSSVHTVRRYRAATDLCTDRRVPQPGLLLRCPVTEFPSKLSLCRAAEHGLRAVREELPPQEDWPRRPGSDHRAEHLLGKASGVLLEQAMKDLGFSQHYGQYHRGTLSVRIKGSELGQQHHELGVVDENAHLVEDGGRLVDEDFRYLPQAVPVEGRRHLPVVELTWAA